MIGLPRGVVERRHIDGWKPEGDDMFVQLIEGRVADAAGFRRQYERWVGDLSPTAEGWQGLTGGVTDDGIAFLAARFASAAAARRNSDRPEQGEWWAATEACLDGPADFVDTEDVEIVLGDGGSDDAGFVQVIRGRMADQDAARALFDEAAAAEDWRDDLLGAWVAHHPDGAYTQVVYFTSEDEARANEAADEGEFADRMLALHADPPRFLDLVDPWLASA